MLGTEYKKCTDAFTHCCTEHCTGETRLNRLSQGPAFHLNEHALVKVVQEKRDQAWFSSYFHCSASSAVSFACKPARKEAARPAMAAKWAQHEACVLQCYTCHGRQLADTAGQLLTRVQVRLSAKRRGCHLITSEVWTKWHRMCSLQLLRMFAADQGCAAQVLKQVGGSLSDFHVGMFNIFCAPRIWL